MTLLVETAPSIWTVAVDHVMLGVHLGTRMTVVRLSNGRLLLHSPIALSPALRAEIDALGEVGHIVCPNLWHHMHAGSAAEAYPAALVHAPSALRMKRPDLRIDRKLEDPLLPELERDLSLHPIRGTRLGETVLFHAATATLVSADLVENFRWSDYLGTRLYLRAGGLLGRPGWHRLLRFFYRDRALARADIDRILALPFDRLILAHGEIVEAGAREVIRRALDWV
jgi:hypothetical protein